MERLTEPRIDPRRGAALALAAVALALAATGCYTTPVTNDATDNTDTTAVLHARGHCENATYNGQWQYQLSREGGPWYSVGPVISFGCTPCSGAINCASQAVDSEFQSYKATGLTPGSLYRVRLAGWFDTPQSDPTIWTEDAVDGDGETGAYTSFDTSETVDIVLADVGDESGTDAQAAVDARRAHLIMSLDKGRGDDPPVSYMRSYVESAPSSPFGINSECKIAMRVWVPTGSVSGNPTGEWVKLQRGPEFGGFQCPSPGDPGGSLLKLVGDSDERSSGARAYVDFELTPRTKRWRNVRFTGCKRDEDTAGFDHLLCVASLGPEPPIIGLPTNWPED